MIVKQSTKYERRFMELLKELHIKYRHHITLCGHEVDFLIRSPIGNWVVEIDGHKQNNDKNKKLLESGYNVAHFKNEELNNKENIKLWLIKLQI